MEPLIAFVGVTLILLGLGAVGARGGGVVADGLRPLRRWPVPLRGGVAAMFTLTGLAHFIGLRQELITMVPPGLPDPALLVTITGVLELAGAAGLLLRRTAPLAAGCLGLLLIMMYPANLYAALAGVLTDPLSQPVPRTLLQLIFLAATVIIVMAERRAAKATRPPRPEPRPATAGPLGDRRR